MFNIDIVSTGSKGNCVIIDKHFMCDAGVTTKLVKEHIHEDEPWDWGNLTHLFISHKHADHANLPLLRYIMNLGITAEIERRGDEEIINLLGEPQVEIYIPKAVFRLLQREDKYKVSGKTVDLEQYLATFSNIHFHEDHTGFEYQHEDVTYSVQLHPQKHHDIVNYCITMKKTPDEKDPVSERLLYCTDLDTVEPTDVGPGLTNLGIFDVIMLEGNFDELWLREYIQNGINYVNPDIDADTMNDDELNDFVRKNYRQIPKDVSAGLFRAVQNMRHLSKQQARAYVKEHLKHGGQYYEIHRSSQFYEKPVSALTTFINGG